MTAKEMFKELGYKQKVYSDCVMYYMKDKKYHTIEKIYFDYFTKMFRASSGVYAMGVDAKTLNAIYKQMEELGWLS